MREILFKAKRIDNGKWVEGYYLRDQYHRSGKDIIFYRSKSVLVIDTPEKCASCIYVGIFHYFCRINCRDIKDMIH